MTSLLVSFKNRPLAKKLGVFLSLFSLLALINFLVVQYSIHQQQQESQRIEVAQQNSLLSQRIGGLVQRLLQGQPVQQEFRYTVEQHHHLLETLKTGGVPGKGEGPFLPATPAHLLPIWMKAKADWDNYQQQIEIVLDTSRWVDTNPQIDLLDSTGVLVSSLQHGRVPNPHWQQAGNYLLNNASNIQANNEALVQHYRKYRQVRHYRFQALLWMGLLGQAAVIGFAFYLIRKVILPPLAELQQLSQRLAQGDLSAPFEYEGLDDRAG